ncbi:hypothetical protein BAU08_11605 [Bordetella bronchialis]|uniref:Uncharacterized protein n=1 Tax=Bordetella bronchialis TaxID=463025 RepID=A0A193FXZ6_9BORD|nr:hypothetical protein BAU06_11405 [Bordetella bronchialis]ANN71884.1 hypothetical protein BAU08_11605 [Bordetella bronchialis]
MVIALEPYQFAPIEATYPVLHCPSWAPLHVLSDSLVAGFLPAFVADACGPVSAARAATEVDSKAIVKEAAASFFMETFLSEIYGELRGTWPAPRG